MPIYEYHCRDCGHDYDHLWRRMPEAGEPAPACPECGGSNGVRKLSRLAACSGGGKGADGPACDASSGFG